MQLARRFAQNHSRFTVTGSYLLPATSNRLLCISCVTVLNPNIQGQRDALNKHSKRLTAWSLEPEVSRLRRRQACCTAPLSAYIESSCWRAAHGQFLYQLLFHKTPVDCMCICIGLPARVHLSIKSLSLSLSLSFSLSAHASTTAQPCLGSL